MPHIVPSDVRDAITNLFPAVKTGGQLELTLGHERQIAIALVDEVPRDSGGRGFKSRRPDY